MRAQFRQGHTLPLERGEQGGNRGVQLGHLQLIRSVFAAYRADTVDTAKGFRVEPAGGAVHGELDDLVQALRLNQFAGRSERDAAAVIDNRYAVGEALRLVHVMRCEDDRAALGLECRDQVPKLPPGLRIESGGWLVEEKEVGISYERASHGEPLFLSAGEFSDPSFALFFELDHGDHAVNRWPAPVKTAEQAHDFRNRQFLRELGLLELHAEALPQVGGSGFPVQAKQFDLAGVRGEQALADFDCGGFSGAIRPEQPEALAGPRLEVEAVHGDDISVGFPQTLDVERGLSSGGSHTSEYFARRAGRQITRNATEPGLIRQRIQVKVIRMPFFKPAVRSLAKRPGFSLMVTGMLALGIAGNTAIFNIYNGLFLRPLPFPAGDRIMDLDETAPKWNLKYTGVANADFHAWRDHNNTFEKMAFYSVDSHNLSGRGLAQRLTTGHVTADMLDVMSLRPVVGRNFLPQEDRPGGAKVVMLGYDLWQRQFGGNAGVLGQVLLLNAEPHTVIGVLPREACFPLNFDAWVPLAAGPEGGGWYLSGIGRLKPGVTAEQASADLTRIHRNLIQTGRKVNEITTPVITPVRDRYVGDLKPGAVVMLGAVAVVLLIACANIAGLMMVRAAGRAREIAIRTALGASRSDVVRQLFADSVLLAVAGAVFGILMGFAALRGMVASLPEEPPRWISFAMDGRFAAFTVLLTCGAAVLFGLMPALGAAKADLRSALHDAARSSLSRRRRGALSALVVGEIGLALVLLIASALMFQAFRAVLKVDPGFKPEGVLSFAASLPEQKYPREEQRVLFVKTLLERMQAIPGVNAAGAASNPPLGGHSGYFFRAEGQPPLGPNEQDPVVLRCVATPGYFNAIGVRFLSGRRFDDRDGQDRKVAIINETFAKRFFPKADPIGKHIRYSWEPDKWMEVVGVTRDVKHYGLDQEMRGSVYIPYRQDAAHGMTFLLRTPMDPGALAAPAREVLRQVDADLPMFAVATMTERLDNSLWQRRFFSRLAAIFAAVAVLLAAGGIYGVISYAVAQRTQEIGIRVALGAPPMRVMRQVLGHGVLLLSIGLPLGILGALGLAGGLQNVLFGVSPRDFVTYAAMAGVVSVIAFAANLLPARRAALVDPIQALRAE